MSVEAWTASQGMLDHWAFLEREWQRKPRNPRVVLDAEAVLDLFSDALEELGAVGASPTTAAIETLLRTHGRLG